jgi:hypothetical protein
MSDPQTPAVASAWPIPDSIKSIPDSLFQQRATEAWRAASQLRSVKDQWQKWFLELEQTGDADPGLAMRMAETVTVCVRALCNLHIDMPTFRQVCPDELLARFPRPPWPRTDPPWQEDQEYRHQVRELLQRLEWHSLSGELLGFLQKLEVAPSTAFVPHDKAGMATSASTTSDASRATDEPPATARHSDELAIGQDNEPELTDRKRSILETMLENEITSERRRKSLAAIVRLINRLHNPQNYKRDFAGLVKLEYLRSREGPRGGVWINPQRRDDARRIISPES